MRLFSRTTSDEGIIILLPDGTADMLTQTAGKELMARDVLRKHPGYSLGCAAADQRTLPSSHYLLPGQTYYLVPDVRDSSDSSCVSSASSREFQWTPGNSFHFPDVYDGDIRIRAVTSEPRLESTQARTLTAPRLQRRASVCLALVPGSSTGMESVDSEKSALQSVVTPRMRGRRKSLHCNQNPSTWLAPTKSGIPVYITKTDTCR